MYDADRPHPREHRIDRRLLVPSRAFRRLGPMAWRLARIGAMRRQCPECVAILAAVAALALLISGMAGLVWLSHWLAM